jgi:hypothetical protein
VRAILRFSVDNEQNSALRNRLSNRLVQAGFVRNANTATYEATHISAANLAAVLQAFWNDAHGHAGPGRIDHFWMYSDRTALDELAPHG